MGIMATTVADLSCMFAVLDAMLGALFALSQVALSVHHEVAGWDKRGTG